jgi:asparagine synthase (glutamine-hydrolysing)
MCAIVGIFTPSGDPAQDRSHVSNMMKVMLNRGPDHTGLWQNKSGLSLGHLRLSIVDLDPRSNQPLKSFNDRYTIVYNGEIYNYPALKQQLEAKSYRFNTSSDTEVLLNSFIEWGEDCLLKLDGMFAFAIWDEEEQRLFIARDRFGEKPLFYYQTHDGFIFASELKALQQHPNCPTRLNPQALREYFELGYILTSSCIIEGVKKLPAAHFMWVERTGIETVKRYWDCTKVAEQPKARYHNLDDASDALIEILKSSVAQRMQADVPVGMFLSGGIDSTLLTLCAKKWLNLPQVKTFSTGFDQKGYNESHQAEHTAQQLLSEHHNVFFDVGKLHDDMEKIAYASDEPFADTSIIPTYYLSQFTKKHVTVSLSGDGADELFAGYETYAADMLYQKVKWVPSRAFHLFDKVMGMVPASQSKVGLYYKLRAFFKGAACPSPIQAHWSWRRLFSDPQIAGLLGNNIGQTHSSFHQISPLIKRIQHLDLLDQMQCIDLETWFVDDILVKLDRMTMAHSLEGRIPFLSNDMVKFALTLPHHLRMDKGRKKVILRHQIHKHLSQKTAARKKAGFNAPVSHWFNGPLKEQYLSVLDVSGINTIMDIDVAKKLLDDHNQRRDDHGYRLFAVFCLAQWFRNNKTS